MNSNQLEKGNLLQREINELKRSEDLWQMATGLVAVTLTTELSNMNVANPGIDFDMLKKMVMANIQDQLKKLQEEFEKL